MCIGRNREQNCLINFLMNNRSIICLNFEVEICIFHWFNKTWTELWYHGKAILNLPAWLYESFPFFKFYYCFRHASLVMECHLISKLILNFIGEGTGLLRLHSTYRHDLKIYSSDEGRVQVSPGSSFLHSCVSCYHNIVNVDPEDTLLLLLEIEVLN